MTRARFGKNYYITDIVETSRICKIIKDKTGIEVTWLFENGISLNVPDHLEARGKPDSITVIDPKTRLEVLEVYENFGLLEISVCNNKIGEIEIYEQSL